MKTLTHFKILIVAITLSLGVSSCGDDPAPKKVDVYLGGQMRNASNVWQAAYWKNGVPTILSAAQGYVEHVAVSKDGKNFYALGESNDDTAHKTLWVNGAPTTMMNSITSTQRVDDIEVSGGKVYVVGQEFAPDLRAVVWVDGVKQYLVESGVNSGASDVFILNNDVYYSGWISDMTGTKVVYWKNNAMTVVTPTSGDQYAFSMTVSGNDIYLLGEKDNELGVWKNGTFTALPGDNPSSYSYSNEIISIGSDVYVVGEDRDPVVGDYYSCYWKNGVKGWLDDKSMDYSTAIRIAKSSKDIYAVGYFEGANWYCGLWKNWTLAEPMFSKTEEDVYIESVAVAEY